MLFGNTGVLALPHYEIIISNNTYNWSLLRYLESVHWDKNIGLTADIYVLPNVAVGSQNNYTPSMTLEAVTMPAQSKVTLHLTNTSYIVGIGGHGAPVPNTNNWYNSSIGSPGWSDLLKNYGIWTGGSQDSATRSYFTAINLQYTGTYVIKASADNAITVYIDGNSVVTNSNWGAVTTVSTTLTAGQHFLTMKVANWGGPASGACQILDSNGNEVWNSRYPQLNLPTWSQGGPALLLGGPVQIDNLGTIAGGGGGGATGNYDTDGDNDYDDSNAIMGGGGGGAGYPPGPGGTFNDINLPQYPHVDGNAGSLINGGAGVPVRYDSQHNPIQFSGAGGNLGQAGSDGYQRAAFWGSAPAFLPGGAGPAILGSSYATWINRGTVLGSLS